MHQEGFLFSPIVIKHMDYTPPVPQAPPPPKPEYVLVEDAMGEPPPVRGPQTLKDTKGNEFKVPF